jgi:carbonic anhydrase
MSRINGFVGRRDLLKILGVGGISVAGGLFGQPALVKAASSNSNPISPDRALKQLLEGNQRFVGQSPEYPDQSKARLKEVAQAQHPFATILSCADSRVPAEIIFDRGIGDIFDVRIAGNIVTPEALGSIEYAVLLLGTPLLMILGHERCGAVTAAIQGEPPTASIASFVKPIQPVVEQMSDKSSNLAEAVENAVVANVKYQIERLRKQAPLLVDRERQGNLKIVGGRYDLDTGEVTILT